MSQTERAELGEQQSQALADILSGSAPSSISPADAARTGAVLRSKRRREAALAAPGLAQALGGRFAEMFDQYSRAITYPRQGGPAADAAGFAEHLEKSGAMPPDAIAEGMQLRVRYRRRWLWRKADGHMLVMFRLLGRVWQIRF